MVRPDEHPYEVTGQAESLICASTPRRRGRGDGADAVPALRFDTVIGLWREGQRRLAQADPSDRPAIERVMEEIVVGLRRRVGGTFTIEELARFYAEPAPTGALTSRLESRPATPRRGI